MGRVLRLVHAVSLLDVDGVQDVLRLHRPIITVRVSSVLALSSNRCGVLKDIEWTRFMNLLQIRFDTRTRHWLYKVTFCLWGLLALPIHIKAQSHGPDRRYGFVRLWVLVLWRFLSGEHLEWRHVFDACLLEVCQSLQRLLGTCEILQTLRVRLV